MTGGTVLAYMVVGIYLDDEPIVAAVMEGGAGPVDAGGDDPQRWAQGVLAYSPEQAEAQALRSISRANGVDPVERVIEAYVDYEGSADPDNHSAEATAAAELIAALIDVLAPYEDDLKARLEAAIA